MSYFGIDLHQNNFVVCRMEANEQVTFKGTFDASPAGVEAFKKQLSTEDQIAVEATTNTTWFCDQVRNHVAEVVVVNSREFKVIAKSVNKTDMHDSKRLAFFLLKGMLPRCREMTQEQQDLKALSKARDQLVTSRTKCINKIHTLHVQNGIKLKNESLTSATNLNALDLSSVNQSHQVILNLMRKEILHLNGLIRELDKIIEEQASSHEGYDGLTSIKGVGTNTAAVILSTAGNIKDFVSSKKFCAYFGLVPSVSQSNSTQHNGRITKKGCKLARKALVQCTLTVIQESPELRAFYEGVKRRRGSGRAIIATARKLLEVMYDVLKTGKIYTDFPKNQYYYPN